MNPYIVVELRALIFEDLIKDIKSKLLGRPKEDIEDDTEIPNIIFEYS